MTGGHVVRSILLSVLSRPVANNLLAFKSIMGSMVIVYLPPAGEPCQTSFRPSWRVANVNSQSNPQAVIHCVKSCMPVIFAKVVCSGTEGRAVFGHLGTLGFARKTGMLGVS